MKILFFIESFSSGGKERRLLELLIYLTQNTNFRLKIIFKKNNIQYNKFLKLNIPYEILNPKNKTHFLQIYRIAVNFKPDIIHSWDSISTFFCIPYAIINFVPIINSHISDAPVSFNKFSLTYFLYRVNFFFSTIITTNSKASLTSYNISNNKSKVIYNGIDLKRFINLTPIQEVKYFYGIKTEYCVVMIANYSKRKNYEFFIEVAESTINKNDEVTFIGAGSLIDENIILESIIKNGHKSKKILLLDKIDNVEDLVNASDIGVLFTYGESISNSILEYMALGKPVVAHAFGGTEEVLENKENGILIKEETAEEVSEIILDLLSKPGKREKLGTSARKVIDEKFDVNKMGKQFLELYEILSKKSHSSS